MSFEKARFYVKNVPEDPCRKSSNDTKLKYYKYFKQATIGNVQNTQPWAFNVEARAKWDAWNSVRDMTKEAAEKAYIDLVSAINPKWQTHTIMETYCADKYKKII